jgi:hypothetical protein
MLVSYVKVPLFFWLHRRSHKSRNNILFKELLCNLPQCWHSCCFGSSRSCSSCLASNQGQNTSRQIQKCYSVLSRCHWVTRLS